MFAALPPNMAPIRGWWSATWRAMIAAFIEAEKEEHIRLHGPASAEG